MKRNFTVLVLIILTLSFLPACAGPGKPSGPVRYEAEFIGLFDTLTQIIGYADKKEDFEKEVQLLKDDLEVYHQLYDIYKSYPGIVNLHDINEKAGQGPVAADPRIIGMLLFARDSYELTRGRVNITMGSVFSIWHRYREAGLFEPESAALPPRDLLAEAGRHASMEDLVIDMEKGTVELLDPAMRLDVGAVAKGYAVEQAARHSEERGTRHLLISVGGNVRAIGRRNDEGDYWRVSVENPDPEGEGYLTTLNIDGLSVVTSGVNERFYVVDGKAYHHIIDPDSLFPENRYLSVTIVTPDSGLADILSTALFNLELEEGQKLIAALPDTEALWCLPDGSLTESPGFAAYR